MGIMDVFSMTWSVYIDWKLGGSKEDFYVKLGNVLWIENLIGGEEKIGIENHGIIYYLESEKD